MYHDKFKIVLTSGNCKLSLGLERKHKHETYTLLRLCLIKFLSAHFLQRGKGLVDYQGRERHGWGPVWLLFQSRKLHSAVSEIVSLVKLPLIPYCRITIQHCSWNRVLQCSIKSNWDTSKCMRKWHLTIFHCYFYGTYSFNAFSVPLLSWISDTPALWCSLLLCCCWGLCHFRDRKSNIALADRVKHVHGTCRGFIKGCAWGKLMGCEDDFSHLVWASSGAVFLIKKFSSNRFASLWKSVAVLLS